MTKNAADPADSGPNKSRNDEKTDKLDEKKTKTDDKKESSLKMSKTLIAVIVGGFIVSILASFGWQQYREIYVIPLEKETTLPYGYDISTLKRKHRNMDIGNSEDSVLSIYNIENLKKEPVKICLMENETTLTLNQLEYFEFDSADSYRGGKFTFFYKSQQGVIEYALNQHGDVSGYYWITGSLPDGKPSNLFLTITREGKQPVAFKFKNYGKQFVVIQEENEKESFGDHEREKKYIEAMRNKSEEQFNSIFSTGQQQLPKAYLELVKSAYGFVANSFNAKQPISFIGVYQNFTYSRTLYYLQPHNFVLNSLDEQVYGLMTLSKLDDDDTKRVMNSWMTTVNEHGYMGNVIQGGNLLLDKIQAPFLFQLTKELLGKITAKTSCDFSNPNNLDYIAEKTWEHSIGNKGLEEVKFLGSSRGIFGLEPATSNGTSSFELLCLLGDMARFMQKLDGSGDIDSKKWAERFLDVEAAMTKYWDDRLKQYGDLENGKIKPRQSTYVPLILQLLKPDSENLKHLLQSLQQDSNFLPFGLQLSDEQGVHVGANYLLIQSLKYYSGLSGPSQELAHNMYSVLKNHLAAVIARTYRADRSFYARYDKNMKPLGPKGHPDGTLIFGIMSA